MFHFAGLCVHVMRDDLLAGGGICGGNKARKLAIFGRVKLPYEKLISYGNAQSNAMAAMAQLARERAMRLLFFAARPAQNVGNLAFAREAGARVIFVAELASGTESARDLPYAAALCALAKAAATPRELALCAHRHDAAGFFIPEGAAIYEARFGAAQQAAELRDFAAARGLSAQNTAVFLPSGTGASAAWLAHFLPDWRVFSTDAGKLGATEEFARQMGLAPRVAMLQTAKNYRFGKVNFELFEALEAAQKASGVKFELLYDAKGFKALAEHAKTLKNLQFCNVIYIHQGGLLGDLSMRARYEAAAAKKAPI